MIEKGGRGLETEIEAEYIVGGMAFDIHPCFHLYILNYMHRKFNCVRARMLTACEYRPKYGRRLEMPNVNRKF